MNNTQPNIHRTNWTDLGLPLILMLTGVVLTGGDWLGILSLDRIQNLWPVALILIGLLELMVQTDHRTV